MDMQDVNEAQTAALKFIGAAEAVRQKAKNDKYTFDGCKETAACKRASMDLTRALVAIRE